MLALTLIPHEATLYGEKQTDPQPRYPATLEYKRLVTPTDAYSVEHSLRNGHPTIIPRMLPSLPASVKSLTSLVHNALGEQNPVLVAMTTQKRYMLPSSNPPVPPGSIYHVRHPPTKLQTMLPSDALQCAQTWKTHQLALITTIRLDLDMASLLHTHHDTARPIMLHVATCMDLLHPLHYTTYPRLLVQLAGRTRCFVVTPDHAFAGLYPFPVHHAYDGYSMVNYDDGECGSQTQWPRALDIRGYTATLCPGHALYIPAYTFVSTQSLDAYTAVAHVPLMQPILPLIPYTRALGALQEPSLLVESVPLGHSVYVVPPLSAAGGAAALAVSRVVEAVMADAIGDVDGVRTWLLHAAHGTEAVHADINTVLGHRVCMACTEVRLLIDSWFGPGAWRVLLAAMCEDRLSSTAWLDDTAKGAYLGAPPSTGVLKDEKQKHPLASKYPMFFPNH